MCKTKVQIDLYFDKVINYKHEKNRIRLWCKIISQISDEQTKSNGGSYFYLYPFGNLIQKSFYECFMCSLTKEAS